MKSTTSMATAQTEEKRTTPPIVCKVKQPRFHIAKRMDISFSQLILIHALALLAALACGGLLIFALGHNPLEVYCEMSEAPLAAQQPGAKPSKWPFLCSSPALVSPWLSA